MSLYIEEKSKLEIKQVECKCKYNELNESYKELEKNYKNLTNQIMQIKLIERFNN